MKLCFLFSLPLLASSALAQTPRDVPLILPQERKAVESQNGEFNEALKPALFEAAKSTVRIWSGRNRLAYGTVIGDGQKILTKWSEVVGSRNLTVQSGNGEAFPGKIVGVYPTDDLAVLSISGTLPPVKWAQSSPRLGSFLAAPQPDGKAAAFGVVSVLERNLRDQTFLGIYGDPSFSGPGVKISEISEDSGAAKSGLKSGDIILKVGERTISGFMELKSALVGATPGSKLSVIARSGGREKTYEVILGNRPQLKMAAYLKNQMSNLQRMNGGETSRVGDFFSHAIQSDMRPNPDQIGGPVVNLNGEVVGISIARTDRTHSFIVPAAAVESLLQKQPTEPSLALAQAQQEAREAREQAQKLASMQNRRGFSFPGNPAADPEKARNHLDQLGQLLKFLDEEMSDIADQ